MLCKLLMEQKTSTLHINYFIYAVYVIHGTPIQW